MFAYKDKDKKQKKKILKRKRSEDENINKSYEEENKQDNYAAIQNFGEVKENTSIDARIYNLIDTTGIKGHINYYTTQSVNTGTYYFEVQVKSLEFNMFEYVNTKRNDEFSKKYYENILQNLKSYAPNIRIGFINSIGDLDLPIGADKYSYGFRANDGCLITDGCYRENNFPYERGDIIGVLIHLKPPMPGFLKNVVQEGEKNLECYIKFYLNGKEQVEEFRGITEGNYHAAVTLYNFAEATINFGPNFKYLNLEDNKNIRSFYDVVI